MFPLGDYNTAETVNIPFNSFTSDDPSASVTITNLAASDIEIHKDGSVTQRASDNGVTVSIDFDGITGNHMVHVDLSDNSDAGYYANGSRITVRMEGTTIDGATINAWIGAFSIGCALRPTTAGRTLDVESTGEAGLDFNNIKDATGAHTLTNITVPVATAVTNRVTADMTYIHGSALTETSGGYLAAAFIKLFDVATPLLVSSTVMRGTDSAALASLFTGITSVAEWLGLLAGKQAGDATALTEIKATGAGSGTYDPTTDSPEAARDRGDSAWITATSVTVSDKTGFKLASDGLDLQTSWTTDITGTVSGNSTHNAAAVKAALNDLSAANVLTQVNAALDAAVSELGVGIPTATPSLRTGMMLSYMALRNQFIVQTSATDALEVYNNAGTKIAKKLISDDGSDYTEAKMASGA